MTNAEFHLARMEAMPLADASVDVVISNCVINMAPDKSAVLREMFRVLRTGGRVAVSDIALKKPLPDELGKSVMAYVRCVAGAITIPEYERMLRDAGFDAIQVVDAGKDLNAYAKVESGEGHCSPAPISSGSCCGATGEAALDLHQGLAQLLTRFDVNEYAASVRVFAVKS